MHQNSPSNFSGDGVRHLPSPLPRWGGTPLPTPHPLGAFGALILAPAALDLPHLRSCKLTLKKALPDSDYVQCCAVLQIPYMYLKHVFKIHICILHFVFQILLSKYKLHYKNTLCVNKLYIYIYTLELGCIATHH